MSLANHPNVLGRGVPGPAGPVGPGGGGSANSGVFSNITTLADLAAVITVSITPPAIYNWVQASDNTDQTWVLRAGTDATDPGSVQRPDDYAAVTNEKVWFNAG